MSFVPESPECVFPPDAGHAEIEQHHIKNGCFQQIEGVFPRIAFVNFETIGLEKVAQNLAIVGVIIDDQHAHA
ncbi:MAG: hypothetical protein BWY82_02288 [Verrucomicrobia bacterium ADurb.Bin474]|nr:MAG: hypothetical protein BWY82_02288 [Verrucomicrobia bacterium ADurb.Bin474]